jgi:Na+/H+ antiporter NhaA
MADIQPTLSKTFSDFFDSEKSSGIVLIVCTVVSLAIANTGWGSRRAGIVRQSYTSVPQGLSGGAGGDR